MITINSLPNNVLSEIFSYIPDTRLRQVCKLWKGVLDGADFKTLMGKIYDQWLGTNLLWESIQLKWNRIFGQPLPFDSDLMGRITWAEKMDKITKFIFQINPGMIAFMQEKIGTGKSNPVQTMALKALKQTDQAKFDEVMKETRASLRDECFLAVMPLTPAQFVASRKKVPTLLEWIKGIIVPTAPRNEKIDGNLSTDRLMPKLSFQHMMIKWVEIQLNKLLNPV